MKVSQHGFTLIEASIAIFIISILIAMAVPMLKQFIERSNTRLVQTQLLQTITWASRESRILGMSIAFCLSDDRMTCNSQAQKALLVFLNEQEDGVLSHKDALLMVKQLFSHHGHLYWRAFPAYRHYILFSGKDMLRYANGTFWYCYGKNKKPSWAIILNQTGRVRTVYPDATGEIKDRQRKALLCEIRVRK